MAAAVSVIFQMADKKINSYFRILSYTKQYWRHIVLTFVFTILFAVLNGLSVYLTIPLLDALFQESKSKPAAEQSKAIDRSSSILPDWVNDIKDNASKTFNDFVLSGDKPDVLIKICFLILIAFILKYLFLSAKLFYELC